MEVAQDLILKPPGSLLVWSSEVQSTTVTLETLLVVVTVLVPTVMVLVSVSGDVTWHVNNSMYNGGSFSFNFKLVNGLLATFLSEISVC